MKMSLWEGFGFFSHKLLQKEQTYLFKTNELCLKGATQGT